MGNLNTIVDSIAADTGRTSGRNRFQIIKAIASAIRFYRKKSLPQTRGFYDLTLVIGQDVYSKLILGAIADGTQLPANLLRINNIHVAGVKGSMVPLPPHYMQDIGTNLNAATPQGWAWEDGKLLFSPVPNSADVVRLHIVRDLGLLQVVRQEDNSYEILASGVRVDETYDSEWFGDDLQDLIIYRAEYTLFMGPFRDAERATMSKILLEEEWRKIESEEEVQDQIMDAVPWGMT